jgi:hypothetical protein
LLNYKKVSGFEQAESKVTENAAFVCVSGVFYIAAN